MLILMALPWLAACSISYSTNGASIPPDAFTVSIQQFPNRAPLFEPTLSQTFTESLKDKFLNDTRLDLVNSNGDLQFEGAITGYELAPVDIKSNDQPASTRLTIRVKVKFTNTKDAELDFDTSFSRYIDMEGTQTQANPDQIEQVVELLVEDIFNKSVANW